MLSLSLCLLSLAATPRVEARPAPILLVLRTATTPAQARREARLHDEVSLLLDDFAVLSQSVDDPGFQARSLPEQLKQVLELANQNEAVAALWLAEPLHGQLMVHVVGIGTGRALIRTLEFDQRSGSEKALALIVRELLGTAFLQAPPETIDPGLREVVRGVRRELPPDVLLEKPASPPPAPVASRYSLSGAVLSGVAVAGAQGRWLSLGARVQGERALNAWLNLGLVLEVHGARDLEPAAQVTSLELPMGVSASADLKVSHFLLSPRLSALVGWNRLWARNADGASVATVWTLRARAGLGVRSAQSGPLQLMLELSVDAVPMRGGVREQSTGADLWRAPWLELQLAAGVCWKG